MADTPLTITAEEREVLVRHLEATLRSERLEEGHTDSREYRKVVRREIEVIEGLLKKLGKSG